MPLLPRWTELRELTRHRTLAFIRQPEAVFWVFAFPIVLAAVLGFAFQGREPEPSFIGVVDATAAGADDWTDRLGSDARVRLSRFATRTEGERELRAGHIDALVVSASPPEVRLDPVRPEAEVARLRVLVALGALDAERITVDPVTELGSRYIDFLFPGLLGMSLMGTGLWSIGFAIADMRQRKVLKRMLVTPMRRSSFLLAFLLSRLLFLAAELLLIVSFGVWVLGVPFRGSLLSFGLLAVVGSTCFAAVGLMAASRVKTIEGISGVLNLFMVPMWLGSGVFFSYERFPEGVQPLLRALPLTALNDALRAGMIDGAGFLTLLPEVGVMLAWTVVPFALALKLFRWT